jgi:hypothetical protein
MENLVPMTVEDDSREAPASLQAIEKYASDGPCAQTDQLLFLPYWAATNSICNAGVVNSPG